jgi:hypothetical protein
VNFFGHAVLAAGDHEDPAFVWGAMLPDFASLSGVRPEVVDPTVAAGVAHHHRADAAFHAAAPFQRLLADGVRSLRESAVSRGSARGAAHVGIELFLDGILVDERRRGTFLRALDLGARRADALRFADGAAAERWWRVQARLRENDPLDGYRRAGFVCDRVIGALARRPRLALDGPAEAALRRILPAVHPRVAELAPALLSMVASALAPQG